MFINGLTTNFNGNFVNQIVSKILNPSDTAGICCSYSTNGCLKVNLVNKITVARNSTRNFSTKVYRSVKGLFNSFNCKVSVSSVNDFKKCNLRITCTFPLPYLSIRIRLYLMKTFVSRKPFSR